MKVDKIRCAIATSGVVARYAHLKLDGHFVRVVSTQDDLRFYSSLGTELFLPGRLLDSLQNLATGTYLGELWVEGKPASAVKTAIKHDWNELQLTFFAIESCDMLSLESSDNISNIPLEEIAAFYTSCKCNFAPFELLNDKAIAISLSDTELFMLQQRARLVGAEGWVLKTGNLTGWAKLKVDRTIDLVICGSIAGEGKYSGLIGSLTCGVYYHHSDYDNQNNDNKSVFAEIASVSGMDDATREELTLMRDNHTLKGRVIECKYQCVDSKGRLRHPRYLRMRDDKRARECTAEQDEALLQFCVIWMKG
jgi:hypothetical protein